MDSILLEAKREYTEQVVSKVTRPLYDEIYNIWKQSLEEGSASPMRHFQDSLENLAKMDEKDMLAVTDRCIHKMGCSYFGDLLTAIFVAHTRVLLSVRKDSTKDGYKLQVPTPNRFVRSCVLCCAREFWKSPYLYYQNEQNNKITKIQVQKNLREAETIIAQAIRDTIRSLLPLKDVLDVAIVKGDTGDIVIDAEYPSISNSVITSDSESYVAEESMDTTVSDSFIVSTENTTNDTETTPIVPSTEPVIIEETSHDTMSLSADEPNTDTEQSSLTEDMASISNTRNTTEDDPVQDAITQIRDSSTSQDLPSYEDSDITDGGYETDSTSGNSVGDFPGWETIEIKSPPDERILMESLSDAISLDEPTTETKPTRTSVSDDITIEAEEL